MRNTALAKSLSLIFITLSLLFFSGCSVVDRFQESKANNNESSQVQEQTQDIAVSITDKDGVKQNYQINYQNGETAYDLLQRVETENPELSIEFDGFEFDGETSYFITSINGYDPSGDNMFWVFNINEDLSTVGISSYEVQPSDKITFTLDEIN